MANNPYANKVIYGNQIIMDLSQDTVVASDVMQGKTFHDATGALLTGTYTPSASGYTIHIFTEDSNLFGNTITISKDDVVIGTTTFDNTGNATFDVQQKGTYVASTTYQGTVYQKAVDVTDEFLVELSEVLDGKTVLPTDDIQIWLKCAGINDKSYTTLAEVLADTDTLLALINSPNAVDYMVRSTTWVSDITANQTAMSYIGLNNYCANTLLNNGGVNTFVKFPYSENTLTRNGVTFTVGSDGSITTNGTATVDTMFGIINNVSGNFSQYFTKAGTYKLNLNTNDLNFNYSVFFGIQYNGVWVVDHWFNDSQPCEVIVTEEMINNSSDYIVQYSVYVRSGNTVTNKVVRPLPAWTYAICNSEYFESVLNVKIPVMTSNTTPSGKAFGDSIDTSYPAYQAMDGSDTSYALSLGGATNPTFGYTFTANRSIYLAMLLVSSSANSLVTYTCKLQGSNDEFINDVHDIAEAFAYSASINDKITVKKVCTLLSGSSSYRVINTARTSSAARFMAHTIQFYGREDVVEPEPSTEMVLYENGTQYVELSNKMSGITNSAVFQSSYIQCSYYSTNACGFSSVDGIDIEGYKSLKVRFKLANNDSYVKVVAADLETNFLNKGINSVKLGFGYRGNVATLYLKDAQYSVTTSDYWASTVSGGNNYIAVDKIWLE